MGIQRTEIVIAPEDWPGAALTGHLYPKDQLIFSREAGALTLWRQQELNVAKVNILIVEMGTVSQPGERASRS